MDITLSFNANGGNPLLVADFDFTGDTDFDALDASIELYVQYRAVGDDWGAVGSNIGNDNLPNIHALFSGTSGSVLVPLPSRYVSFETRWRAKKNHGLATPAEFTEWSNVLSVEGTAVAITPAEASINGLSFGAVRRALMEARQLDVINTPAPMLIKLGSAVAMAYRYCYEKYAWMDAKQVEQLTPTAEGLITAAQIDQAKRYAFYDADPRPVAARVCEIKLRTKDSAGLWLERAPATVWGEWWPQCPRYTSTAVEDAKTYNVGDVRFDENTGHCFRALVANALGADIYDDTKWEPLPLLSILEDATLWYAQSLFLTSNDEQGQASRLRKDCDDLLAEARTNEMRNLK